MSKQQVVKALRPVSTVRVQRLLRQEQFADVLQKLSQAQYGVLAKLNNGAEILFRLFGRKVRAFIRSCSHRRCREAYQALTCRRRRVVVIDIMDAPAPA